MGEIRFDCPHAACRTRGAAFHTFNQTLIFNPTHCNLFATCSQCQKGVVFEVTARNGTGLGDVTRISGQAFDQDYMIVAVWPEPPKLMTVDALPDEVREIFLEAEHNFVEKQWRTAAMGYRAAIETALKHLNPEGSGMLAARIRAMKSVLPALLIDLLDHVKFLGNEGAHGGAPEAEDLGAGRDFTTLFFTYMFELPARVAAANARRQPPAA